MEMTFPLFAQRSDVARRSNFAAMLATITARQASSRTALLVRRRGARGTIGDAAMQRIRYFARSAGEQSPACGAFWQLSAEELRSKQDVYQAGSINVKVRDLFLGATGEQFNHAGHGVMRKS